MTKENNKKILDKLMELFVSKHKIVGQEVLDVWLKLLSERYADLGLILEGIDDLIWSNDDFPTIGKIAQKIQDNPNTKRIYADKIARNLEYKNNGTQSIT